MVALIIIGIIAFVIALPLWSTVTFEIASNGKKTVITAKMFGFIKHDFVFPSEPKEPKKSKPKKAKRSKKRKKSESKDGGKSSEPELQMTDSVSQDFIKRKLGPTWDSDARWFDFEYIENTLAEYKELIKHGTSALAVFLRHMSRKIRVSRLDLYIKFGTGAPDKTGIAYGAAHAAAGSLNAFIRSYFNTKTGLVLYLDPDYVNSCFEFELGSIIKTRAAHVLHSAVAALARFIINRIKLKGSVGNVGNFGQAPD